MEEYYAQRDAALSNLEGTHDDSSGGGAAAGALSGSLARAARDRSSAAAFAAQQLSPHRTPSKTGAEPLSPLRLGATAGVMRL